LRYREADAEGTIVHRSLPLGADAKVAEAVRAQIALGRAKRATDAAEQRAKAAGDKRRRKEERLCAQLAQNIVGGGRRRRQQIREWYADMQKDPSAMMKFTLTGAFPEPRKPGRPRNVRLW
jgi:hypothetical protein